MRINLFNMDFSYLNHENKNKNYNNQELIEKNK